MPPLSALARLLLAFAIVFDGLAPAWAGTLPVDEAAPPPCHESVETAATPADPHAAHHGHAAAAPDSPAAAHDCCGGGHAMHESGGCGHDCDCRCPAPGSALAIPAFAVADAAPSGRIAAASTARPPAPAPMPDLRPPIA